MNEELRYWEGWHCIVDLSEVIGIDYKGSTGKYEVYSVTFRAGCSAKMEGLDLLDQFKKYKNIPPKNQKE